MTRRMIDSGLWSNESFAALPAMARLLQIGIINHADDQGRMKAHPAYLRSQIFPYDDVSIDDVYAWLKLITRNGTAIVYESDNKEYIQLVKWWDYQSLQYASPSEYPAPDAWQDHVRYNAKGGMVLTFNWTTTRGEPLPDTCDCRGNLVAMPPTHPPGNPPGNPGESPPEQPTVSINKDQLTDLKEEEEKEAATRAAAAAGPQPAWLFALWDKNMPGTKTPVMVSMLQQTAAAYSRAEIEEAVRIACAKDHRDLRYVQGILKRGAFSQAPARDSPPRKSYRVPAQELPPARSYRPPDDIDPVSRFDDVDFFGTVANGDQPDAKEYFQP